MCPSCFNAFVACIYFVFNAFIAASTSLREGFRLGHVREYAPLFLPSRASYLHAINALKPLLDVHEKPRLF